MLFIIVHTDIIMRGILPDDGWNLYRFMMCKNAGPLECTSQTVRACNTLSCIILCSVLVWQQPPRPINNAVCLGLKPLFGGRCWQIVWAFKKCLHFPWILIRWKTHLLSHAKGRVKERLYCSKCYQHIRQTNRVPEEEVEEGTSLHSSAAYVWLLSVYLLSKSKDVQLCQLSWCMFQLLSKVNFYLGWYIGL